MELASPPMPVSKHTPDQLAYRSDPEAILKCDVCGETVPPTDRGLISWDEDDDGNVSKFRVTHQGKCDRQDERPHSSMLNYVASLGLDYVGDAVQHRRWQADALTRLIFITWAVVELNKPAPPEDA